MNWDRIEGQWKQRRGRTMLQWGKVMNDELAAIAGKHEQLVGLLQEKYGIAKDEAKRQLHELKKNVGDLKKSNAKLVKRLKPPGKLKKWNRKPASLKGSQQRH